MQVDPAEAICLAAGRPHVLVVRALLHVVCCIVLLGGQIVGSQSCCNGSVHCWSSKLGAVPHGLSRSTRKSLDTSEREEPYGSLKKKKIALPTTSPGRFQR
jgi:hypothetical protein